MAARVERDDDGRFKGGRTPNPGGLPRLVAAARVHAPDAVEVLAATMRNPRVEASVRVAAAAKLLDCSAVVRVRAEARRGEMLRLDRVHPDYEAKQARLAHLSRLAYAGG
jgi:hypothetical protein